MPILLELWVDHHLDEAHFFMALPAIHGTQCWKSIRGKAKQIIVLWQGVISPPTSAWGSECSGWHSRTPEPDASQPLCGPTPCHGWTYFSVGTMSIVYSQKKKWYHSDHCWPSDPGSVLSAMSEFRVETLLNRKVEQHFLGRAAGWALGTIGNTSLAITNPEISLIPLLYQQGPHDLIRCYDFVLHNAAMNLLPLFEEEDGSRS